MREILDIIKNIYYKIKSSKLQRENFSRIKPGDMIWAKMPLKRRKLKEILEEHRVRPYLVVRKDKNCLICYQSSSKKNMRVSNYDEYHIKKEKYMKKRDSWINLYNIIKVPICNIEDKYISVNKFDLQQIEKRLEILEFKKGKKIEKFNMPIIIDIGDVVEYKNALYYIYASDNVNVYGIKIYRRNLNMSKNNIKFIINDRIYYILQDEIKKETINRAEKLKLVDIAYPEEVEILKKIIKKSKEDKKHEKTKLLDLKKEKNHNYQYIKKEKKCEIGTVFKINKSKVLYLFEKDGKHYGVDIVYYIIAPKLIEIKNIERKEVVEVKEKKDCLKYIEKLLQNNIKLTKDIKKLYKNLKISV